MIKWINKILRWFGIDFPDVPEDDARTRKMKIIRSIVCKHYITREELDQLRKRNENWDFVKGRRKR